MSDPYAWPDDHHWRENWCDQCDRRLPADLVLCSARDNAEAGT